MQLITNFNPGDVLTLMFGRVASFKTVDLAKNSWVELAPQPQVELAWHGNPANVVQPLASIGVQFNHTHDLSCIRSMKPGDSVVLIDPTNGRAFCWSICS